MGVGAVLRTCETLVIDRVGVRFHRRSGDYNTARAFWTFLALVALKRKAHGLSVKPAWLNSLNMHALDWDAGVGVCEEGAFFLLLDFCLANLVLRDDKLRLEGPGV